MESKDGFDDFKNSSNKEGVSVDKQVLHHNQEFIKGVIENSSQTYKLATGNNFVVSSTCKANKNLIPILESMQYERK
jgi:hypothetical protein